jgi:hypothetical protein
MTPLDLYLDRYFLNVDRLAAASGLSRQQLQRLLSDRLIPGASYVLVPGSVTSYVFGALPATAAASGEYFHPATCAWIARASKTINATAVMSFSPVEYARSSRKRLVDDLKAHLTGAAETRPADFAPALPDACGWQSPTRGVDQERASLHRWWLVEEGCIVSSVAIDALASSR